MERLRRSWTFIAALIGGSVIVVLAPADMWSPVSTHAIIFFSIQAGAVLPAMMYTIGFLNPSSLTAESLPRYTYVVRRQLNFLSWLFALDIIGVVLLVSGEMLNWTLLRGAPREAGEFNLIWIIRLLIGEESREVAEIDPIWVITWLTTVVAIWALLRSIPFIRGIQGLMNAQIEHVEDIARRRREAEADADVAEAQATAEDMGLRTYGRIRPINELTG